MKINLYCIHANMSESFRIFKYLFVILIKILKIIYYGYLSHSANRIK